MILLIFFNLRTICINKNKNISNVGFDCLFKKENNTINNKKEEWLSKTKINCMIRNLILNKY